MMVILNAESFGMAQLHQLRGRVGRGEHGGLCVLVSNAQPDSLAHERLTAIVLSTDGFELSERDLEIRGEGDVLGDAQSGRRSSLRILRVVQDADLIQDCRGLADQILSDGLTPELSQALQEISQAEAISRS
jgi:ATP-dependent DNA helicase RecG